MVRRGIVVVAVCVLAGVAAMATPGEAQAFHEPSPYQSLRSSGSSSSFFNGFRNLLRGSGSSATTYGTLIGGETTTTKNGMNSALTRARVGARFLPKLGLVATRVSLVGTAGYFGWRIYQHFSDSSEATIDLWIDSNTLGKDALINGAAVPSVYGEPVFQWSDARFEKTTGTLCSPVGGGDCWVLELKPVHCHASFGCGAGSWFSSIIEVNGGEPDGTDKANGYIHTFFDHDSAALIGGTGIYGFACCGAVWYGWGLSWMADRTLTNFEGRVYGDTEVTIVSGTRTVGSDTLTWRRVLLPDGALGEAMGVNGSGSLTTPDLETEYEVPANAGTTPTDITISLDEFDTPCGRALINHVLNPLYYPWIPGCVETAPEEEPEHAEGATAPKILPKPQPGETATAYRTRLRTAGLLGTIIIDELTEVELPTEYQWQPSEVVQIHIGTPATTIPLIEAWPIPGPVAAADSPITIEAAPTEPTDPRTEEDPLPPGYGGGGDFGSCEPWLDADVDFSPLTGLSFGSNFPFGLFTWVASILGDFNTTPDAPAWTFDMTIPATAVSPEYALPDFTVDLEWADDYMSTIRTILTFVLWVGAVWFFATGLLGFRTGSNPAEAVDEA